MEKASLNCPPQGYTAPALILTCILLIFLYCGAAFAQTWYIKPTAEIPLRRGQGSDYKILAIVPNGTAVSIVEEDESWAKVLTEEGKEGWILKRYLTDEPPLEEVLSRLRSENSTFKEQVAELQSKNRELTDLSTALQNTLDNNKKQLSSTMDKYQQLVKDTSDVIAIKNNLIQSKQTITKLQQEFGSVAAENKRLKASQNIKWFLAGGGTLIFGCIIGMISARSKKRKPSLY